MERKEILAWFVQHRELVRDEPERVLDRTEQEVRRHAIEDAWLAAKRIAEGREAYFREGMGAHASPASVAREVCGGMLDALARGEPAVDGHESDYVESGVLRLLEPAAREILIRYVHDLAEREEHDAWLEVQRFTRDCRRRLPRRGRFASRDCTRRAPHYSETAVEVLHLLAAAYEQHAHPGH